MKTRSKRFEAMHRQALFLILLISLCGWSRITDKLHTPSREILLFDGKTLRGWYTFIADRGKSNDPKQVFSVQNGMIHISGEEYGSMITEDEFADYKLILEYKWGEETYTPRKEKARDSGLLIHSTGPDGGYRGRWMRSIECQLIEGGTGDLLVVGDSSEQFSITSTIAKKAGQHNHVFQKSGEPVTINNGRIDWFARDPEWKDVKGFRGSSDIENPVGEWNTIECIAHADSISVYLNGTLVNQASQVKPRKGRIQLQSEGAELFVRRMSLVPLK